MTDPQSLRTAIKRALDIAEEPDSDMPRYTFDQWQKRMFEALEAVENAALPDGSVMVRKADLAAWAADFEDALRMAYGDEDGNMSSSSREAKHIAAMRRVAGETE